MAWTAEKVRALRESNPSETAKKDEESGKWTAERVRALRTSSLGRGAKGVLRLRAPTYIPRRWRITGQGTTWALRMPWTAGATS